MHDPVKRRIAQHEWYLHKVQQIPTPCKVCGTDTFNKFFCSLKCKNINNHKEFNCLFCGVTFIGRIRKYCSASCSTKGRSQQVLLDWINGVSSGLTGKDNHIKQVIRRWLIEQRGYKCELCGWGKINPFSGCISLEIDHIDGNRLHNRPENLRVICPNCHSLTETYRGLNRPFVQARKLREMTYTIDLTEYDEDDDNQQMTWYSYAEQDEDQPDN